MKKYIIALSIALISSSFCSESYANEFTNQLTGGACKIARREARECVKRERVAARTQLQTDMQTAKATRDNCNQSAKSTRDTALGQANLTSAQKTTIKNTYRQARLDCRNAYNDARFTARNNMDTTLFGAARFTKNSDGTWSRANVNPLDFKANKIRNCKVKFEAIDRACDALPGGNN